MKINVRTTQWAADGTVFQGGQHEIDKPGRLFPLLAGAEAAGTIEIVDATDQERAKLDRHVQSQENGEKAYAKAQTDGRWHHGNLSQFVADRDDRLAYDKSLEDGHPDKLDPAAAGLIAHQLDQAKAELAEMEVPS